MIELKKFFLKTGKISNQYSVPGTFYRNTNNVFYRNRNLRVALCYIICVREFIPHKR